MEARDSACTCSSISGFRQDALAETWNSTPRLREASGDTRNPRCHWRPWPPRRNATDRTPHSAAPKPDDQMAPNSPVPSRRTGALTGAGAKSKHRSVGRFAVERPAMAGGNPWPCHQSARRTTRRTASAAWAPTRGSPFASPRPSSNGKRSPCDTWLAPAR